jgi:hypothetical protein
VDPSMSVKRKVTVPVGRLGMRGLLLGKRAAIFKATFAGGLPGSSGWVWSAGKGQKDGVGFFGAEQPRCYAPVSKFERMRWPRTSCLQTPEGGPYPGTTGLRR